MTDFQDREIVQIRITSGETIMACFVEGHETKNPDSFILSFCLEMEPLVDDFEDFDPTMNSSKEYYILKPWVTYTEDLSNIVSVNPANVVYVAKPSQTLITQYMRSCMEIQSKMRPVDEDEEQRGGNVVSFPNPNK